MSLFQTDFTCPEGAICGDQSRSKVGGQQTMRWVGSSKEGTRRQVPSVDGGTDIYHRTVIIPERDGSGQYTGKSHQQLWIVKNGTYQKAAISNDGGKTYAFYDPNDSSGQMAGVAGADLQKSLQTSNSQINTNIKSQNTQALAKYRGPDGHKIPPVDTKAIVNGEQNNATQNPNDESTRTADKLTPEDQIQDNWEATLEGQRAGAQQRNGYGNASDGIRYPENLNPEFQDILQIEVLEYKPREYKGIQDTRDASFYKDRSPIAKIFLPIPSGIADSNQVGWGDGNANILQQAGNDLINNMLGDGELDTSEIGKIAADPASQTALRDWIAKSVTGVSKLRRSGLVLNNNMELLFDGPQIRSFTFTYFMSARSESEAKIIKQIVRILKQSMAPKKSKSFMFVKAPHTFMLTYMHKTEDHKWLNSFKECALTGMNMSYTPDGQYSTFHDGAMTRYQMQLAFQELEPIFDSDYKQLDNDTNNSSEIAIGY